MKNLKKNILISFIFLAFFLLSQVLMASVIDVGPSSDEPSLSPTGHEIAFVTDVAGSLDIWIVDRKNSSLRQLIQWTESDEREPDWSPDGDKIIFASNRNSDELTLNIWSIAVDGSNPKQLTRDSGNNDQPRWSPDGQKIAFVSDRNGSRDLWIMNFDGSNQKSVLRNDLQVNQPCWSPDGTQLIFIGCGKTCHLFLINVDETDLSQLTFGTNEDMDPDWSNEGIIFTSNKDGLRAVWMIKPDGSNLSQITNPLGASDFEPKWDPMSYIIFSRTGVPDGPFTNIWSLDKSGEEIQLTDIEEFIGNQPPVANANGPYIGEEGNQISFDGSGSYDPDGTIVSYEWDWDNDGTFDESATTPIITHSWNVEYSSSITLRVTDDGGLTATDTTTVDIVVPPSVEGDIDGDGDIDRDDLDIILAARNTPASGADDPRDLDGDGMITGLDARKLVLLCTCPRCVCP